MYARKAKPERLVLFVVVRARRYYCCYKCCCRCCCARANSHSPPSFRTPCAMVSHWSYENTSDGCNTLSDVSSYNEKPNPSDWSCLSSRARKDIVVIIIMIVVGVEVGVGVVVVVRARTRIAHLQSKRPARWFRGHRWSYGNTSDRCNT
jgi:hypothetical protein